MRFVLAILKAKGVLKFWHDAISKNIMWILLLQDYVVFTVLQCHIQIVKLMLNLSEMVLLEKI